MRRRTAGHHAVALDDGLYCNTIHVACRGVALLKSATEQLESRPARLREECGLHFVDGETFSI
jgi:hypothetical protein